MIEHLFDIFRDAITTGNPFAFIIAFWLAALVEFGIPDFFIIDAALLYASYNLGALSPEVILIVMSLLAGRLFGASVVFGVSRIFGQRFNRWLERRFPSFFKKLSNVETQLDEYTMPGIVFIRVGPGFITAASVLSGAACVRFSRFLLGVAISSIIADGARIFVSFLTKHGYEFLGLEPNTWEVVLTISVLLAFVFFGFYLAYRSRQKGRNKKTDDQI